MSRFLWRMGGALAAGVLGLSLVFWQLEHASLLRAAGEGRPAIGVYALLFAGLVLVGLAVVDAHRRWVRFLGENPGTRQLPAWLMVALAAIAVVLLVVGIGVHAAWVRAQDPTPLDIDQGFVAYEVSFAALTLVPLVLLAARRTGRLRRG